MSIFDIKSGDVLPDSATKKLTQENLSITSINIGIDPSNTILNSFKNTSQYKITSNNNTTVFKTSDQLPISTNNKPYYFMSFGVGEQDSYISSPSSCICSPNSNDCIPCENLPPPECNIRFECDPFIYTEYNSSLDVFKIIKEYSAPLFISGQIFNFNLSSNDVIDQSIELYIDIYKIDCTKITYHFIGNNTISDDFAMPYEEIRAIQFKMIASNCEKIMEYIDDEYNPCNEPTPTPSTTTTTVTLYPYPIPE